MEELLRELIDVIEAQANSTPWNTIIAAIALLVSTVTLGILLWERYEKNRPYLQISFELVRSSLACIVMRNTGNSPLTINSLHFDDTFVKQLPKAVQARLNSKAQTSINVFPNRMWVLSLDVNVFDIINKYENKLLSIDYSYAKLGKKAWYRRNKIKYHESVEIDFNEYAGFLLYLSDLDEFKNSVNRLEKTVKAVNDTINKLVSVTKVNDEYARYIAERGEDNHG